MTDYKKWAEIEKSIPEDEEDLALKQNMDMLVERVMEPVSEACPVRPRVAHPWTERRPGACAGRSRRRSAAGA